MQTKFTIDDVKFFKAKLYPRYWEDCDVNGIEDTENGDNIPLKYMDEERGEAYWDLLIDADTGVIANWKQGTTAIVSYKVCDDGVYTLLTKDNEVILIDDQRYVPLALSIDKNGYGDYVKITIDENGKILNWDKNDLKELFYRD